MKCGKLNNKIINLNPEEHKRGKKDENKIGETENKE